MRLEVPTDAGPLLTETLLDTPPALVVAPQPAHSDSPTQHGVDAFIVQLPLLVLPGGVEECTVSLHALPFLCDGVQLL